MKFTQLPIGQRFELDGAVYVKTSPMMAAKEGTGESRFMARYLVVKVLGGEGIPAKPREAQVVGEEVVRAAFDQFHSHCQRVLKQLAEEVPPARLEALSAGMEEARALFLDVFRRG